MDSDAASPPSITSSGADSDNSSASTTSPPPSVRHQPPTSLDLLGARNWVTQEAYTTSSPVGAELERLTTEILEKASRQQWDDPLLFQHVVPDFIGEFDHSNGEKIDSFAAYRAHHGKLVEENPEYRFYPMNVSAQVYGSNGTAAVHVLLKVVGHPRDVVRESVVIVGYVSSWRVDVMK